MRRVATSLTGQRQTLASAPGTSARSEDLKFQWSLKKFGARGLNIRAPVVVHYSRAAAAFCFAFSSFCMSSGVSFGRSMVKVTLLSLPR
jgi:hypothetical protein